jgi:hypothetical protein
MERIEDIYKYDYQVYIYGKPLKCGAHSLINKPMSEYINKNTLTTKVLNNIITLLCITSCTIMYSAERENVLYKHQ